MNLYVIMYMYLESDRASRNRSAWNALENRGHDSNDRTKVTGKLGTTLPGRTARTGQQGRAAETR
jgi:hypothetical protein